MGGYLLQGGFGWNGRVHGPACMSVGAIDVVTAAGELVRADAESHSDLFWAARGSGPGFFGAVARFHLRLQPKPAHVANAVYLYPLEVLEDVFRWAHEIGPRVPRTLELMVIVHRDLKGELEIAVTAPALVGSAAEAAEALALLETCPVRERAKLAVPNVEVSLPGLYAAVHQSYPDEHRYSAGNMWTHAPVESDPAGDEANVAWVAERMGEMEHLASGIQLADENLGQRPARFVTEANLARLDEVRAAYDPDGRFHAWMGRLRAGREATRVSSPTWRDQWHRPSQWRWRRRTGPIDPSLAVPLAELDRLRDPAPLAAETGWCVLPDGVRYVAVRTPMPAVSAALVDWWFDWHPRDPLRYRIWHPAAHSDNSVQLPAAAGAKAHWGATHHPVEDVGTGTVHARIAFGPPSEIGFSSDTLDDPAVGTIVCGWVGDDRRRMRRSAMAHVFLAADEGLILRSHFWLGAALRPYLPAPLADPAAALLNRRTVRDLALPRELAPALARHCAEEYANLAALPPELHRAYA